MLNLALQGYSRVHPQGGRWLVVVDWGVLVACWVPYPTKLNPTKHLALTKTESLRYQPLCERVCAIGFWLQVRATKHLFARASETNLRAMPSMAYGLAMFRPVVSHAVGSAVSMLH